jgi:hypothetical protein
MSAGPPQAHRVPDGAGAAAQQPGAQPFSSRDENATDGASRFRRRGHVCEAAVRRRLRRLQGFDTAV